MWRAHSCVPCRHSCRHVFGSSDPLSQLKRVDISVDAARKSARHRWMLHKCVLHEGRIAMDFGYTPEQNHLRATIRSFAENEIRSARDGVGRIAAFPVDVFRDLGKLGVLGAVFPEELGGAGYSYVEYSIIMEEIARVDPSIALSLAAHVSLCTNHIYLAGNQEQKNTTFRNSRQANGSDAGR